MERPKIKIKSGPIDKITEYASVLVLLAIFFITTYFFPALPDKIPIHFNILGEADKYGSHYTLMIYPLLALIFYVFLIFLKTKPHIFNYPVEITGENAHQAYTFSVKLVRYLTLILLSGFFYFEYAAIQIALGKQKNIGSVAILIFAGLIIYTLIYYIIKIVKTRK